ncbi:MAG: hypothetical protein PHF86_12585 [Candidatus Nanoarchaeia archaeon]|nr:hypothetical protein [Candidatus Nanoarchaeia archaeon]
MNLYRFVIGVLLVCTGLFTYHYDVFLLWLLIPGLILVYEGLSKIFQGIRRKAIPQDQYEIFSKKWWVDDKGHNPVEFSVITANDIETGKYRPLKFVEFSLEYVKKLEQLDRYFIVYP